MCLNRIDVSFSYARHTIDCAYVKTVDLAGGVFASKHRKSSILGACKILEVYVTFIQKTKELSRAENGDTGRNLRSSPYASDCQAEREYSV